MTPHKKQPATNNHMKNLQIAMMERYASKINLDKLHRFVPESKITLFDIKKRYPMISKFRGGLRRILPYNFYGLLPNKLDELSDKQNLIWSKISDELPDTITILLFPPAAESNVAEELISRLRPSWAHSIMTGIDRLPEIPDTTIVTNSRGIHSVRIAEFVMSFIFALSKNLPEHINQNKKRFVEFCRPKWSRKPE